MSNINDIIQEETIDEEAMADRIQVYLQDIAKSVDVSSVMIKNVSVEKMNRMLDQHCQLIASSFVELMKMSETKKQVSVRIPERLADDFRKWQVDEWQHSPDEDMKTFTKEVTFEEGFTVKDIPEEFEDAFAEIYSKTTEGMWKTSRMTDEDEERGS